MTKMKHFFLRAVAYAGLYAEIFSALCRWVSRPDCWGKRKPWRTVVTEALVAARYLPPTSEEVKAQEVQRRINCEHEALTWQAAQPETIQTCLKSDNPELLKNFYKRPMWAKSEFYPEGLDTIIQVNITK